jgi:glycine cleavage system H lipoate-binding protein
MACPFLKEGRAQYCHAAPARKLILEGSGGAGAGRCASPEYYRCDLAQKDELRRERCPHLEEIHVQYCEASSPTKLIPFSELEFSSCADGGYHFCDSYLGLAGRHDALAAPAGFLYAPNHFWLATEASGLCHLGIDSFLAEVVANVDGVTFVTTHGTQRPVISLTVHGVEWPMTFPNPLLIQKVNHSVRSDPKRVIADPYGSGWLFAGWELPERTRASLIGGPHAAAWQAEERERLAQEIHETLNLSCDGGKPVRGVGQFLPRQQLVCLLQHFFSSTHWGSKD